MVLVKKCNSKQSEMHITPSAISHDDKTFIHWHTALLQKFSASVSIHSATSDCISFVTSLYRIIWKNRKAVSTATGPISTMS